MKNTVGISFSKNQCYLTQLTQENKKLSLASVNSFCYEQNLLDALPANADIVKSLISNSTRVILALPSQDALLKNMTVDAALTDEEIICHIHSQSLILFGYQPEQLCVDYKTRSIEDNNRHIIVAACHQSKISAYQHCFNELKIPLDVVDIDVFALLRLTQSINDELIDLTSPITLAQLNSFISTNDDIKTTYHHDLKANLDKLGFSYEALTTTLPFHSPVLISMGASLWSEP